VVIAVVLIGIGSVIESSEKIKTTLKNELATVSSNTNNDATGIVADYLGVNRSNLKVVNNELVSTLQAKESKMNFGLNMRHLIAQERLRYFQ